VQGKRRCVWSSIIIVISKVEMGKKYIPVKINGADHRIYLDNVERVFKVNKKNIPAPPPFAKKGLQRKDSYQTEPGTPVPSDHKQFTLSHDFEV
jgi:hypothetical protein